MIYVSPPLPELDLERLSLFHVNEPILGDFPFLTFYGSSTTANLTHNSSRIQAYVYSLAGFYSFPRLTVAPTSPLYAAVNHLPSEIQGDEVARGLAIALLASFAAIPWTTRAALKEFANSRYPHGVAPAIFDEMHAAHLATGMVQIGNAREVWDYFTSALKARTISWTDVDVILPVGSIHHVPKSDEGESILDENGLPCLDYESFAPFIETLGSSAFLPTTKLQRAPSRHNVHSRSRNMSKEDKVALRREMCELSDTESNYLARIRELLGRIACDSYSTGGSWPSSVARNLQSMYEVNESFYQDIQTVLDTTECDAIKDIEGEMVGSPGIPITVTQNRKRDYTGALLLAKSILKWFPHFIRPYHDYLNASADLSAALSRLSSRVPPGSQEKQSELGEQYLRSLLIEPVQRLPRYTLFIDKMLSLLPASHTARPNLLKAKDTIADICALDHGGKGGNNHLLANLQKSVNGWPRSLKPLGRLITAVDAVELRLPFNHAVDGLSCIMILFAGKLVLIRQLKDDSMSARAFLARLEQSHNVVSNIRQDPEPANDLEFGAVYDLDCLQITESADSHLIYLADIPLTPLLPHETLTITTQVFSLKAPYHGKTARFAEEIVKARIEDRIPLSVRDSEHWSLRRIEANKTNLGILAIITENNIDRSLHRQHTLGKVRLNVVDEMAQKMTPIPVGGASVSGQLSVRNNHEAILEVESSDGSRYKDSCMAEGFGGLLRNRRSSQSVLQQISFNAQILGGLPLGSLKRTKHKAFRPKSPVKMLSSILGGVSSQSSAPQGPRSRGPTIEDAPRLSPPEMVDEGLSTKVQTVVSPVKQLKSISKNQENVKTSLQLLEDTFSAYILALRSRCGNVVGKILQTRASADELRVNELYNSLIEEPSSLEITAVMSVDVLFAAFEKFLRYAWKERMGPLLAPSTLKELQASFDSENPVTFAQNFKHSLDEMSPQNQRAFAAVVRLLSDLLDASGNDGDRGILIASFAEALVLVGNSHDYIMLLDRLVEDYDILFEHILEPGASSTSATSSLNRTTSFNTSSLTSNASSLRRRLGLGANLTRENSKSETESKVASIWRTLSKNSKSAGDLAPFTSLSKQSLVRSRSTDRDSRMGPPSRPVSRDRPTTSGSIGSEGQRSRPISSHTNASGLSNISEDVVHKAASVLKKKRRSSFSDLHTLRETELRSIAPLQLQYPEATRSVIENSDAPIMIGSQAHKEAQDKPRNRRSPQRSSIPRPISPNQKENSPLQGRKVGKTTDTDLGAITITSHSPNKANNSQVCSPPPRAGLSERSWPPNANIPPSVPQKSPPKMRLQSPRKIRQRLSQEQGVTITTAPSLQAEMDKIGQELSAMSRPGSSGQNPVARSGQKDIQDMSARINALDKQLKVFVAKSIKASPPAAPDQLLVSETKIKRLDALYKEANAENEALYDRFNDELGRVLARVKKGEGVAELKAKLTETQDEVNKLRAENAKLKRDSVNVNGR
ncbi:uncharacterized protein KY384_007691 [Bacidia gigantensis]|uniref:uncharacterized protein n=1 Tax=Bacidia gigantensis TaxID=2732470 RepID=UPI001D05B83D|nr:uncharacterized protein KY384_007691 [Bacidia gigantensis]KAG8527539.1 hypothetical protein KY384_007691 [Bacidia gigantensis]